MVRARRSSTVVGGKGKVPARSVPRATGRCLSWSLLGNGARQFHRHGMDAPVSSGPSATVGQVQ